MQAALENLRVSLGQGVRRIVCQAPTGSGKTSLAAAMVEGAQRKNNRMAFVVPNISLIDQTVERFYAEGIRDIGVIQANHAMTDWSKPVQVCSVQTLLARGEFPQAKTVVRDECHTLFDFDKEWMGHPDWRQIAFIGLSATPWTKGMGNYYHSLLVAARTQDLIDKGLLSKFTVFACPKADVSKIKMVTNKEGEKDYHKGELSTAQRDATLTADVIRTWKERWGKGKSLYFGVDRAHAETLHLRFQAAGVRSAYQDGETSSGDRKYIERSFHNGEIDVAVNVGTLTTGVDWDVRCLGLCRPTKSEKLYVQIVGRGLRIAEGKDRLVMLDHTDSTLELGLVTDIHHEHLDDGKGSQKREAAAAVKPPLPRPCPNCASLTPRLLRVCQDCGFKLPLASGVVERDGVLVEIVPGDPQKHAKKGAAREWSDSEKRLWWQMFKGYAIDRDKTHSWVLANYREKFGGWPPRHWESDKPVEPSFELASWVKARTIRYIKGKQKGEREAADARVARAAASARNVEQ